MRRIRIPHEAPTVKSFAGFRPAWCRADDWRSAIEGVRVQDRECKSFGH